MTIKKSSLPTTGTLDRDTPAMESAIATLIAKRIVFDRPSLYQLKVGAWNFYPSKGTIIRDGEEETDNERGLDAFIAKATASMKPRVGHFIVV